MARAADDSRRPHDRNKRQRTSPEAEGATTAAGKKTMVKRTDDATGMLLNLLSTSKEVCQVLKENDKNKRLGQVHARFAATLDQADPVTQFTEPIVAAKIKNLCSAWRSVDQEISGLRNHESSTEAIESKKSKSDASVL